MALSGFGLSALIGTLASVPLSPTRELFLEPRTELSFLEDWLDRGQGKGYPSATSTQPDLLISQMIANSPHARQSFPGNDEISDLFRYIADKSREYDVPVFLVLSLIDVESGFQPGAISSKGAVGLMQLHPATAEQVAAETGMIWYPALLKDPKVNVDLGLRYLSRLKSQFGSDEKALAAYNIGPHALHEKLVQGENMPQEYLRRVRRVLDRYQRNSKLPRKNYRTLAWGL